MENKNLYGKRVINIKENLKTIKLKEKGIYKWKNGDEYKEVFVVAKSEGFIIEKNEKKIYKGYF